MAEDITQTQVDILTCLQQTPETYFSIKSICEMLHVSPQRAHQGLRELVHWGYRFDQNERGEIKYRSAPDLLFPHEIVRGLKSSLFATRIRSYGRVASTNALAYRLAERGEPEGTVVIAERQTAGKGRLGRTWSSPPKVGLYLSLILRPPISPALAPGLSLIAALSVAESIRHYPKLKAMIKWPNDVLLDGKKVAGVLTELSAELDRIRFVIVGIGINVNHSVKEFPEELRSKATSLQLEATQKVDRIKLVQLLLTNLEKRYYSFVKSGLKNQIGAIREYSALLTKKVSFKQNGKTVTGTAIDIDNNGMLVVDLGDGKVSVGSGEVSLAESY
jgi:BirA family biotin operon repressor/biotin-[acetyl-CoA-carboxylase] ligase